MRGDINVILLKEIQRMLLKESIIKKSKRADITISPLYLLTH